ncbi:antirestriction protein ArdA [Roseobacter sp.]|uniref:antirestriction protein ArdA n=1 Tax=Roseobacter sp. TaxID=1907202 RepID=UPI002966F615|nr:antirestriction protein ArdA [Roseobacter sp.]MDW3181639.1 antirestriction protein ArdA [Roseobacter sp.]
MTHLYAQPYDLAASGFYFDSAEEFKTKAAKARNNYGNLVEEFEIQFIDGDHIDCDLAKAWRINQANIRPYFDAVETWDDHDKQIFIIAVGEVGYNFDPETATPSDFEIDIYHARSMTDLAEDFVAEGLFGDIPDHLANYIDYDTIARDLAVDYTETEIAGDYLIYRAA